MYLALKHIHLTAITLSFALFALRAFWMLQDSARLQQRWVKIVPHIIDTVLLVSALSLAVLLQQYPFVDSWLTAKVLALLAYIGFGTVALKRGRSLNIRVIALAGAILSAAYIVSVALSRTPWPWA
ncbi:MAG: SirB2 family protein [Marinobacterium sp.]|nr:SirB2 family protein [Marinobacterium sp.]